MVGLSQFHDSNLPLVTLDGYVHVRLNKSPAGVFCVCLACSLPSPSRSFFFFLFFFFRSVFFHFFPPLLLKLESYGTRRCFLTSAHAINRRIRSQTAIMHPYYSDVEGQKGRSRRRKKNQAAGFPMYYSVAFQASAYRSVQLPKCV